MPDPINHHIQSYINAIRTNFILSYKNDINSFSCIRVAVVSLMDGSKLIKPQRKWKRHNNTLIDRRMIYRQDVFHLVEIINDRRFIWSSSQILSDKENYNCRNSKTIIKNIKRNVLTYHWISQSGWSKIDKYLITYDLGLSYKFRCCDL